MEGVPPKIEARRKLKLSREDHLAVVVGRLFDKKRVDVALRALALLPQIQVIVVGDGPQLDSLQRTHPDVRFVGNLNRAQALEWISAADLLVSASLEEGCPTVVREARFLGTEVVCRAVGDLASWAKTDHGLHLVD
jgi:glycosyltransferase involved in cell wall biosynthesis